VSYCECISSGHSQNFPYSDLEGGKRKYDDLLKDVEELKQKVLQSCLSSTKPFVVTYLPSPCCGSRLIRMNLHLLMKLFWPSKPVACFLCHGLNFKL